MGQITSERDLLQQIVNAFVNYGSGVYQPILTALTGQTATGTDQGTAFVIANDLTEFTTIAASTGAILPSTPGRYTIIANGANDLTVYPASGGQINALGTNAGYTQTKGTTPKTFIVVSALQVYV